MADPQDYDDQPGRALVRALVAMVAVALLVGASVGLAVMAAAKIGGLEEDSGKEGPAAGEQASLYMPSYEPTEDSGDGWNLPRPVDTPSALPSKAGEKSSKKPKPRGITLFAAPQQVSPGERINFNGVYQGGDGVSLQIQRKQGGTWTDFPVTAPVRGGSFETWIVTSQAGRTQFRVYDESAQKGSNTVTVQIG